MENIEHKLRFKTEDGIEKEANVIDIFGLKNYPNKEYIVYTFSDSEEEGKVCISILEEADDSFNFKTIEDETEWKEVQNAIKELEEDLEQGDENGTV